MAGEGEEEGEGAGTDAEILSRASCILQGKIYMQEVLCSPLFCVAPRSPVLSQFLCIVLGVMVARIALCM